MPAIGDRFSHYEILAKLGEGGMGEVFRARDTSLERDVALKFLAEGLRQDHVSRERFVREAKSAATLNHPNICVVHEALEVDGLPFIVMEHVEGESLKQRLEKGPLPLEDALGLASQIADAMSVAHAQHIVHRDLKPANVMLTKTGHIKVMDFGLAKRAAAGTISDEETVTGLTGRGTTVGTLAYMAPEQLLGRPVDERADIFSFGIILYEMVTRRHPFKKEEGMSTAAAIVAEPAAPAAQHAPGIPKQLEALLTQMLAKAPADRPASMRAIHDRIERILLEVQPRPELTGLPHVVDALARSLRKPRVAIPALAALLAIVALGAWVANRQAKVRWAREVALPEIQRIVDANDVWRNLAPAYVLAEQAEKIIPDDPTLAQLFARCSLRTTITTQPPGARVYLKEHSTPEAEWTYLGVTPLEKVRVPIGIFRWKFEKDGYEPVSALSSTWAMNPARTSSIKVQDMLVGYPITRTLDKVGSLPPGMVRVQGATITNVKLADFYIDKYEVTNKQFKAFMDGGGYRRSEYWQHAFVKDGKAITREEALRAFVDQTGQPGPAAWQAASYPEGQGDYPVSGISWYEAAAYATYVGKSLPTVSHWGIARGEGTPSIQVFQLGGAAVYAPFSNFRGKGPVAVGSLPNVTTWGAVDMAGNVREWCWNEGPTGRVVRGGAWDDNIYMFGNRSQAPPMDRSIKNGFRCARYPEPDAIPAAAFEPVKFANPPDVYKTKPVSDEVFAVYKEQFLYDKTDLRARVDSRQENPRGWVHEVVTFDAAYGGERIMAHLFLPRNVKPPYQTVVYFPGSAPLSRTSSANIEEYYEFPMFLSFVVKNGRAALFPVYKGTFERSDPALAAIHMGNETRAFTDYLTRLVKDVGRSIDYLETRPDIDATRLAFYGMSWGGVLGPIITAVEPRFRTSVLTGGYLNGRGRPEANAINYVARVRTSTLMLNGKYDRTIDSGIKPMFDLLGTRDKKLVLDETDHVPSTNLFIRETLAWVDAHLGPVKR